MLYGPLVVFGVYGFISEFFKSPPNLDDSDYELTDKLYYKGYLASHYSLIGLDPIRLETKDTTFAKCLEENGVYVYNKKNKHSIHIGLKATHPYTFRDEIIAFELRGLSSSDSICKCSPSGNFSCKERKK